MERAWLPSRFLKGSVALGWSITEDEYRSEGHQQLSWLPTVVVAILLATEPPSCSSASPPQPGKGHMVGFLPLG